MAYTVDWIAKNIYIPKTDLIDLGGDEEYLLQMDNFHQEVRRLEWEFGEGLWAPQILRRVNATNLSGVTYAPFDVVINGYTITFDPSINKVTLSGSNTNLSDVMIFNGVSIVTNNSAGLTYSKQVEDMAYTDARVYIDTQTGEAGQYYPLGTASRPVSNLTDAQSIIEKRNLPKRLFLKGSITVQAVDDVSAYDIVGSSPKLAAIDVIQGGTTTDLVLKGLSLTGDLNGNINASVSTSLTNLDDFDGTLNDCGLAGVIQLGAGGNTHEFIKCYDETAANDSPILDCGDIAALNVVFASYSGSLTIVNFSDVDGLISLGVSEGYVNLDSSCTAGTIVVSGDTQLIDNSGPGCTVISSAVNNPQSTAKAVWDETL